MEQPIELAPLADVSDGPFPSPVSPLDELRRLSEVPVDVSVEMGRARMTVGETLALHTGSIITLNRMSGEPVDLLVNGTVIARGEVVVIDEQFGLRVTHVLGEGAVGDNPLAVSAEPAGADL